MNDLYDRSTFIARLYKDGSIVRTDTGGEPLRVGFDLDCMDEIKRERDDALEIIENWKPYMAKHGYITLPKTPEEIDAAQAEFNSKLLAALDTLTAKIERLEQNGIDGNGNKPDKKQQSAAPGYASEPCGGEPRGDSRDTPKPDGAANKPGGSVKRTPKSTEDIARA